MSETISPPYRTKTVVIFRDVDAMGHVNNAVYFTYMETARTQFFMDLMKLTDLTALPVIVAKAECTYKSAAFFNETLHIDLGVVRIGRKSFDMVYRITAASDSRLVAFGKTVMVTFDYTNGQTIAIPAALEKLLKANRVNWPEP